MLTIILAESELERIPFQILSHPAIISYAKKLNKKTERLILDSSFHHSALRKIPEGNRRGRPDIVHIFLLTTLESIVNKRKHLKVIVHTRNNEAIYIHPETRLMRNYTRFIGLMEQLFEKKKISSDDKNLLEIYENVPLEEIVEREKSDFVIAFSPEGEKVRLLDYFKNLEKKNCKDLLCIIGGFPHGDFHCDIKKYVDETIAIYDKPLSAWTVANEVLVNYENIFLNKK